MTSEERKQSMMRKLFLGVWTMFTFILIFCIIYLVNEMRAQGQSPLRIEPEPEAELAPLPEPTDLSGGDREVTLYFADAEGRGLTAERGRIDTGDAIEITARHALDALADGPRELLTPLFPDGVKVRAVYLIETDELVVDFSRELSVDPLSSAATESLMVYGVVNTLTAPDLAESGDNPIRRVRFLLEGAPLPLSLKGMAMSQADFPKHLDLANPIKRDLSWVSSSTGDTYVQ